MKINVLFEEPGLMCDSVLSSSYQLLNICCDGAFSRIKKKKNKQGKAGGLLEIVVQGFGLVLV